MSKLKSIRWINFISQRFSRVDRKGRTAVTSTLASLGVCFGVMALIVTISVMNGFQMEFIDAIMEVSSYHLMAKNNNQNEEFTKWCSEESLIKTVTPFYEAQGLMVGRNGKQSASLIRAIPEDVCEIDSGFSNQLKIISGTFDVSGTGKIVLGYTLARNLGVKKGDKISILALSGSSDVSLLSNDRNFEVTGTFYTGYGDINSTYAFINIEDGKKYFGSSAECIYGIKLTDSSKDSAVTHLINKTFNGIECESWRSYNRTFFGALRVEKNMLMLLVFLIFVVVAVNIYNGMRRIVYERREEIAVISALGGTPSQIQSVFIMQGFMTGVKGAIPGLILGLFVCMKMETVFMLVSKVQYYALYFVQMIINPANASSVAENPMFSVYGAIPARMFPSEILLITFFGIFSSLAASWAASKGVLKLTVAEVLRDE